ncbi:TonB-dependent receptor, partial [Ralstonia solanacearum]
MSPTAVIVCARRVGAMACAVVHPFRPSGVLFHRGWGHARLAQMFALSGLLMASAARADTDLTALPLEQLMQVQVTSVSKYAQPVSEAPSSVSVITAAD